MKKTSTILAIGSSLALGSAQAEVESSFHVGYSTDYVWRGINQGELAGSSKEGLYEYGIDFTGDCNCGATWNAGIWRADYALAEDEFNIYGGVSKDFGGVELSLGLIRYITGDSTTEISLGAGTSLGGLDVSAAIYYDVDSNDGNMWGELSVGKSYDVGGATLDIAANIGTTLDADASATNNPDDYVTYGISAALSKELGDNLTGSIYIAAETTEGRRAGDTEGDDLYGGISLSYGF
ncbi:hypothetical protein N9Z50_01820 [Akkermansiaceae bacterium]|nr:hypothetical protein [Akkermansiaceae bacterium]MDB4562112.1 hypothetical protein [Akkermansiaceae bacterium]